MAGPRAVMVKLGVEAQGAVVIDLKAVEAHVAPAILVAHMAHAHGDEGAAVLRPGGEHRQFGESHLVALEHHLLAGAPAHGFRHPLSNLREYRKLRELVEEGAARLGHGLRHQLLNAVADGVKAARFAIHAEGHLHALQAAEDVHRHRHPVSLGLLEEQRGTAPGTLAHAVRDGGHLEVRIHLHCNARQLPGLLKLLEEGLEVAAHGRLRGAIIP